MTNNTGFEEYFARIISNLDEDLSLYKDFDLVVGIPFTHADNEIISVLTYIDNVLQSWLGKRQLILCVGSPSAQDILNKIENCKLQHPLMSFLLSENIEGHGTAVRATIEISKRIDADLLLFRLDMQNKLEFGIEGSWLDKVLIPIQGNYDLVLGNLQHNQELDCVSELLVTPLLEIFYGLRVNNPLGGIYSMSHDFVEMLAHEARFWGNSISGSGIDIWIISRALMWNLNIAKANFNNDSCKARNGTSAADFVEVALTLFESIKRDIYYILQDRMVIKIADELAGSMPKEPLQNALNADALISSFRLWSRENHDAIRASKYAALLTLSDLNNDQFKLSNDIWSKIVLDAIHLFIFSDSNYKEIPNMLAAIYQGRLASHLIEINSFRKQLASIYTDNYSELLVQKSDVLKSKVINSFWQKKDDFILNWSQNYEKVRPPFIPLGYMEYVPGKPIVIPKKISGKDGKVIQTDNIFKELRKRYNDRFNDFLYEELELPKDANSSLMIEKMEAFMMHLEQALNSWLPGDLCTEDGLQEFVDAVFENFPPSPIYTVSSDLLRELIVRFPPVNLMIRLGHYQPEYLLKDIGPRHGLSLAYLVENNAYSNHATSWLLDVIKPDGFETIDLQAMVIPTNFRMGVLSSSKLSYLNHLAGRIIVSPLETGMGGKYPRLRYLTSILRRITVAENYSYLFRLISMERKNMGLKLKNSLSGSERSDDFSAISIFENCHHRSMIKRIFDTAMAIIDTKPEIGELLIKMVDGYGLSQVMENNVFLTSTAWSWASFSYKGGVKIPTPSTTSVENRWFNHDFLELLYEELGYDVDELFPIILRLIQEGKSGNNLLDTFLPTRPKEVAVIIQDSTNEPSKYLKRYENNPILEPIADSIWESKYVLNPGALRISNKVYLFYRAVGDDDISHIGLAITDGYKVLARLSEPIFSPLTPEEKAGCEDPRLVVIEDKIFMLYTAYDGNIAQIAAASISIDDFEKGDYLAWKREGLAFKNIWDKDAILFPEKINGKYVIYHRIEPSIWITYMPELKFPINENHAIIIGPRPGRMWDSLKIGAGAQPLKTKYGWLLIYHGVDHNYVYRLGVILVDLNNPDRVIFRSPNPILEPAEDFEIGMSGAWVPNVVFTCGAVAANEKEILEDDDEILVYYGAADTSIGLASATLADLIPEKFRKCEE